MAHAGAHRVRRLAPDAARNAPRCRSRHDRAHGARRHRERRADRDLLRFRPIRNPAGSVAGAIADAGRRGLVIVTEKGKASTGPDRWPSKYALGWLPQYDGGAASNRWKAWRPRAPIAGNIESTVKSVSRENGGKPRALLTKTSLAPTDKNGSRETRKRAVPYCQNGTRENEFGKEAELTGRRRDKGPNDLDLPLRRDRPSRIGGAEAEDAALRRVCLKGDQAYARALTAAGYQLKLEQSPGAGRIGEAENLPAPAKCSDVGTVGSRNEGET